MKPFKSFLEEGFVIPPHEIDDLIYKTIEIVKNQVVNDIEIGKDVTQKNLHLEILHLLRTEWEEKRVETNFVFRVVDRIFRVNNIKKTPYTDVELR